MRSKLYDNFGGYKVWQRPLNKGRGFCFEVRNGNRILFRTHHLHVAMMDAKARHEADWDAIAAEIAAEKARAVSERDTDGDDYADRAEWKARR
jgi:hypothetical protein